MKKNGFILLVLLFGLSSLRAYSLPQYLDIYDSDKFAKPAMKNMCNVCHVSPGGGGPLNTFGKAFDSNGHKITNDLRQKFPALFDLAKALSPRINRVKPAVLVTGKETKITILGNNFAGDDVLKIDGSEAKDIQMTFVNSKRIDITITLNDTGVHTFQIINVIGQASNIFKVKVKPLKA